MREWIMSKERLEGSAVTDVWQKTTAMVVCGECKVRLDWEIRWRASSLRPEGEAAGLATLDCKRDVRGVDVPGPIHK